MGTLIKELSTGDLQQDLFTVQQVEFGWEKEEHKKYMIRFDPTKSYPLKKGMYAIETMIFI